MQLTAGRRTNVKKGFGSFDTRHYFINNYRIATVPDQLNHFDTLIAGRVSFSNYPNTRQILLLQMF
jgi:hypothetical protein